MKRLQTNSPRFFTIFFKTDTALALLRSTSYGRACIVLKILYNVRNSDTKILIFAFCIFNLKLCLYPNKSVHGNAEEISEKDWPLRRVLLLHVPTAAPKSRLIGYVPRVDIIKAGKSLK